MKLSVVLPTFNGAADLPETLASLAGVSTRHNWELIVVDNNSNDGTREVIQTAARNFPVPLKYAFESEQGRSAALNAGIRLATGDIIATTDDDIRVQPDWLDAAVDALHALDCHYVGGKVLPIWKGPQPRWIPNHGGKQWAVIALLDFGPEPIPYFKYPHKVPLGGNMAFRREAFDRAGLWSNRVGRKDGTLLGQEAREWALRARAAGLRGYYTPAMVVRHVVHNERLNKAYFRRWFYWHGISRAIMYRDAWIDMQAPEDTSLDFSRVPHILGVPRFFFRTALREMRRTITSALRDEPADSFDAELWLWFFAGVLRQRWRDRKVPRPSNESSLTASGRPAVNAGT
jgi:glycosyltransferase involved in cell wall biosynthesis